MLCNCRLSTRESVRDPQRKVPLTGTFDFRWPRNATIRIAFQDSDNRAALALAARRVSEALEAWGVSGAVRPDGPALAYKIVPDLYPPGGRVPEWLLDEEKEKARTRQLQAQSAGDAEGAAAIARDAAAFAEVACNATLAKPDEVALAGFTSSAFNYDVLISVAPLPAVIAASELLENEARAVVYAQSELGAYARREDLGLPTAFLGRPYLYESEEPDLDSAWLNSREGRFTVLHEVGHILGLAHEHQNPNRQLAGLWRPDPEIADIIRLRRGFAPINHDFIALELTNPFPRPLGAEPFSQWRQPTNAETAGGLIDSVMVEPIYRCMLTGQHRHGGLDCRNLAVCPEEQALYKQWTDKGPTESDKAQLKLLYRPL